MYIFTWPGGWLIKQHDFSVGLKWLLSTSELFWNPLPLSIYILVLRNVVSVSELTSVHNIQSIFHKLDTILAKKSTLEKAVSRKTTASTVKVKLHFSRVDIVSFG